MRILLHICCGPCAIIPALRLQGAGHELLGYFYNPNIQPLAEYIRRREAAMSLAERLQIPMLWAEPALETDYRTWLAAVANTDDRCGYCWKLRLQHSFSMAAQHNCDAVTSSLLYSRYQQHERIEALGTALASEHALTQPSTQSALQPPSYGKSIHFYYDDFRSGWQEGITLSKEWGLYRQPYCGCIYSEQERYAKALERLRQRSAPQEV